MEENRLKVVVFTSVPAHRVARIINRIREEVAEAQVVGVLYAPFLPKPFGKRIATWRKKMKRLVYWRYVLHRISTGMQRDFSAVLDAVIRFVHAAPRWPNGHRLFTAADLKSDCEAHGIKIFIGNDIHAEPGLEFVRSLNADLGLVFGTKILKPVLFQIPRLGSINIHKRKVPDYRGGGAVGLWEMRDGRKEIGVTVHRVEAKVDVGAVVRSAVIPIDPWDDLESLALKADVVGCDLIVAAIRDFGTGTVTEIPQVGPSKFFRIPSAEDFLPMKKGLEAGRSGYGTPYRWPRWKLLLKSLLYVVPVTVRNWRYRRESNYPVMILYHHLVSDRPHRFGVSTTYFLRQVNYLLRHYRVVSLSEAVDLIRKGGVKVPTVAITFDDGYADNYISLRAVTEETGVPLAYFISTGNISSGQKFSHDGAPEDHCFAPNTWEQIEVFKRCGYEIGSHTRNHADCGSTDEDLLRREIVGSSLDIEERIGPTPHFSFPFGFPQHISAPAVEIACATYKNVFSGYRGANFPADHRRIIKRANFPHTVWELELQLQSVLMGAATEPEHLKERVNRSLSLTGSLAGEK
jgi:peptidoglycan/xylan/chitin deacetylase (PgdA/CDA1 family)